MTIRFRRREDSCGLLSPSPSVGWQCLKHSIWCSSLFQGRRRDRQSRRCTFVMRGSTVLRRNLLPCRVCWGSVNFAHWFIGSWWGDLHLLQAVAVVCTGSTVVDHLFDFTVWTGILHCSVFVAAANAVVCLSQFLISTRIGSERLDFIYSLASNQDS